MRSTFSRGVTGAMILAAVLGSDFVQAAELRLGSAMPLPEGKLELPVLLHLEHNEAVSGLQFEIVLDPATSTWDGLIAGSAATSAGKMLSFNAVDTQRYRVIVAGFNQTVLMNGPVAMLRLSATTPDAKVAIENPVMSDPEGHAVISSATGGSVQPGKAEHATPPASGTPPAKARPACGCGGEQSARGGDAMVVLSALILLLCTRRVRRAESR